MRYRIVLAACARRRQAAMHRAEKGAYPGDLTALSPAYVKAVPVDRFSGRSLVYQNSGDAFVLYSVGQNRGDGSEG